MNLPHIDQILKEWETDCVIDQVALDESSIRFAKIHGKYLGWMMEAKLTSKRLKHEEDALKKDKTLYYTGKMCKEDMDSRGWAYDPFSGGSKPLKSDMDIYYDSDPELVKVKSKIEYYQTMVECLEEILNTLKWRHSAVRNVIDWRKFTAGA